MEVKSIKGRLYLGWAHRGRGAARRQWRGQRTEYDSGVLFLNVRLGPHAKGKILSAEVLGGAILAQVPVKYASFQLGTRHERGREYEGFFDEAREVHDTDDLCNIPAVGSPIVTTVPDFEVACVVAFEKFKGLFVHCRHLILVTKTDTS